jgi:hypothetical protein
MSWWSNEAVKTSISREDVLAEMNENTMFDLRYQRARYLAQKENVEDSGSTIEGRCCHTIFRHLIHVFVLLIIVSFVAMILLDLNSNPEIHFDDNFE